MQDSQGHPLFEGLYCSQEKGLSLLLNKTRRKTEEHALHMTVLIVSTVGTLPLHNLVPYVYWKNSQWLGTNCNYEKR